MQLTVDKVNKSFGQKHVLKDISFTAQSGVATGFLGRNGSGKTTTIRIIMDIYTADSGVTTIDGRPSKEFISKIGYLPEERGLYPKRIISDQMTYLGELRGMKPRDARKRGKELLEKLDAGEYFDKKLDTLSKGNQQKIQLAISLINDPDIIILDEPFSGLDPVNSQILKKLVQEQVQAGKMVFFSSHQMSQVEQFCDDICMIRAGEIVLQGSLRDIKKTYPRDRVLVIPEESRMSDLRGLFSNSAELKRITKSMSAHTGGGFLINLNNETDKAELFNCIASSGIDLDTFTVVEPTLEEIFVEESGEEYEAV